jgi:hypothetical protein
MSSAYTTHQTLPEVETLNALLRGKLAAVETYDQAMDQFGDSPVRNDLETILQEHADAEILLREKILHLGGEPIETAGLWTACVAAFRGEPHPIGPATILATLRQGEEQAINELEDLLKHDNVNLDCKNLIRTTLLPDSRKHVEELNRLMGGMN